MLWTVTIGSFKYLRIELTFLQAACITTFTVYSIQMSEEYCSNFKYVLHDNQNINLITTCRTKQSSPNIIRVINQEEWDGLDM
jgi:hypothetical protein